MLSDWQATEENLALAKGIRNFPPCGMNECCEIDHMEAI
jgi:hypothetical protein